MRRAHSIAQDRADIWSPQSLRLVTIQLDVRGQNEKQTVTETVFVVILGKLRVFETIMQHEWHYHCLQPIHLIDSDAMNSSASIAICTTQPSCPGCTEHIVRARYSFVSTISCCTKAHVTRVLFPNLGIRNHERRGAHIHRVRKVS